MDKINGGFYLKARCIQNSEIAHAPPHVREIWDWLLKEANHRDKKVNGMEIKRGQCLRSYKDIQDGLHWMVGWRKMTYSNTQCEIAMKWLKKRVMVATQKTTRGMVITILNYEKYQTVENYESHKETYKRTTVKPQSSHTINKNVKNVKNEKNKTYTSDFLVFWRMYPNKTGKGKAFESWQKQKPPLDDVLKSLEWQIKQGQWTKDNGQYIPHPATYLNQRRWEDEKREGGERRATYKDPF